MAAATAAGIAGEGTFTFDRSLQQRFGFFEVPGPQLERPGVGDDDLRIDRAAKADCLIDGGRLAVGCERLVQAVGGGQRDCQGVVENRRFTVVVAGQGDALGDCRPGRRDRAGEIPAGAFQARPHDEPLKALFRVGLAEGGPERFGLIQ
jgi:hypothetical protein